MNPILIGMGVMIFLCFVMIFLINKKLSNAKNNTNTNTNNNQIDGFTKKEIVDLLNEQILIINDRFQNMDNDIEIISDHKSTYTVGNNTYREASYNELGYEISNNGNDIVFNKNVILNNEAHINIFDNMIVPIYIDFNNRDQYSDLQQKSLYLCDGMTHTLKDATRFQTPDLRGRFILGGQSTLDQWILNDNERNDRKYRYQNGSTWTVHSEYDNLQTSKSTGGGAAHKLTIAELATHGHSDVTGSTNVGGHTPGWIRAHVASGHHTHGHRNAYALIGERSDQYHGHGSHNHSIPRDGSGHYHNNLPPYMVLAYFIYKPR